ncbi:MAG TPA: VOC family protein [Bacteroidales bacterium]|nr:VOC family protein [Bacteroidales bacterium]
MKAKNPVVHFEMPAHDTKRMAAFYTKVFGWDPKFLGPEMGNYVTVATTETDDKGRPKMPGAINGGFYPRTDQVPDPHPSLVISVENIKDTMKEITRSGGKLIGEPVDIPGIGTFIAFTDTEGNRISILQPSMQMG